MVKICADFKCADFRCGNVTERCADMQISDVQITFRIQTIQQFKKSKNFSIPY
jgi:hypothetical protein